MHTRLVLCLALLVALAGCGGADRRAAPAAERPVAPNVLYRLGPGDRLRVNVFQEPDLSGEFAVDGAGRIALPMIGGVEAEGLALAELENRIESRLEAGFLRQPQVSIQMLNYRPFYILGEVNNPGSYPYVEGMTVLNAVALSGGYSYRADKEEVTITRRTEEGKRMFRGGEISAVLPGDIITVPERFF